MCIISLLQLKYNYKRYTVFLFSDTSGEVLKSFIYGLNLLDPSQTKKFMKYVVKIQLSYASEADGKPVFN